MRLTSRVNLLLTIGFLCGSAFGQQVVAPTSLNSDPYATDGANQNQSLGDLARKMRKDHTTEVQMSAEDAKKLFQSVDKVFDFAAEDTGFSKRAVVKRQLVGPQDVEKYTRSALAKEDNAERFARSEMTMKKFGLLPRDFNLRDFLVQSNGKQVAGYYDPETKSIYLLNWIPLARQIPIMAHELTHALQDQNYNLRAWQEAGPKEPDYGTVGKPEAEDDSVTARHAVTEGQAMVVMIDYLIAPYGRSVQNTPGIIYSMEDPAVKATYDSELLHSAPMILREVGTFPYQAGLIFEGELLAHGGKAMAFAGAFARPPRNTHEVLQPRAYIENEKLAAVSIPDVRPLLGGKYEIYDAGSFGELDVRGLLKQYGDRIVADELASAWRGGEYVTFRRSDRAAAQNPATSDMALLYVSRWKSAETAERFARLYTQALSHRYQQATPQPATNSCEGKNCPVATAQVMTEEGPVVITRWADNTVLVSESFDATTAAKLRDAVHEESAGTRALNLPQDELGLRLCSLPGFAAFQEQIGEQILGEVQRSLENH